MEPRQKSIPWKTHIIAAVLLMAFAFFINRGIEIKGLYMDDLYLWSCYGEQSFMEYVFPIGGTRFRFIFYIVSYLVLGAVGTHINLLVPLNIILNGMIGITVYLMGRRMSRSTATGFIAGVMFLLSRMSYYQISQVYGLMETLALWCAIGILYCLYRYLNSKNRGENFFLGACGLFFTVCFIHERFMALIPLFFVVLFMKREKNKKLWLLPLVLFALVLAIRMVTIGTLAPAGTGGTDVADTFSLGASIGYALSQAAYIFGVNAGPEHLNGLSWQDSPRLIKFLVLMANAALAVPVICFVGTIIKNKKFRIAYLQNSVLFIVFTALCIGSSSVTVRVELRWVYVSLTAALLFFCYMIGTLAAPADSPNNSRAFIRRGMFSFFFILYLILMIPVETFYRSQFPNIYLWPNQLRYNSLAEETYGRYGDGIFGKTIYILGNSYEMSEFTADTFFKVYDKDRKAEGTNVTFIEDVRELGQITDEMLVLREDPAQNGFQDITDFVRQLKCSSYLGYYRDGWMDEEASVRVMAGESGEIRLEGYYPGELTGEEQIKIAVEGGGTVTEILTAQSFNIVLKVRPYESVKLDIKTNFYFKDAAEQRGGTRLALVVKFVTE